MTMIWFRGVVFVILLITTVDSQLRTKKPGSSGFQDFQEYLSSLCEGRSETEYFRLSAESGCREVVRCDKSRNSVRLASVKCPTGLVFDIARQTCDWKDQVNKCDEVSKPRLAKPNLNTEEPVCGEGQLQCGSGECILRTLFCDERADCQDGSDENVCKGDEDPNKADVCDPATCFLPDCFCSVDGTRAPGVQGGKLELSSVPMMITITFNGAVTGETVDKVYNKLFRVGRLNPNGCTPKATFFVSHKYTDYSAVQELHRTGHEIGVFSITSEEEPSYWTEGDYETWLAEMAGDRLIIEKFANITDGTVVGVRAPYLLVGGNQQFSMMADQFFAYDSSISVPLASVPVWPYTLHYRMPHKCPGNGQNCPSKSHPVWELPINELDRREDPEFDEFLTGCHLVSSCSSIYHKDQFRNLLQHNFDRHYGTNRAPLSLSFDPSWLISNEGFSDVLDDWMSHVLNIYPDVYFVTELQAIQWMQNPTSTQLLRDFPEWKEKCAVQEQPHCQLPNACPLTTKELPGETHRLHTCLDCPKNYPWIEDPTGDGFRF